MCLRKSSQIQVLLAETAVDKDSNERSLFLGNDKVWALIETAKGLPLWLYLIHRICVWDVDGFSCQVVFVVYA